LLASVRYGREYLKSGGLNVVAWNGDVPWGVREGRLEWTVEKRGPLQVRLRCQGQYVAAGEPTGSPFTLTLEFVSSKSWVGITQSVARDSAAQRKINLGVELDLAHSGRLLWDQDVGYWLYGVLEPREQMTFTANPDGWQCLLGLPQQASLYATSTPSYRQALGWGHFQEAKENGNVVAFGIADFASPGQRSVTLRGNGAMTIRVQPSSAGPAGDLRVQTFYHFIPVPAQHTARTSPAAMMMPLEVKVGR
jgi:hypothetical protein